MGRYYNSQQKAYIWWRQEGRCGDCGERVAANEQYHHILNWKDGGITSIDNGVMLCKSCHDSSHNNAKFRDSIMLSHNDFKYGNFSKSGESEYSRTRLEIKNEIEKLSYLNVSENFFQEQKQVKNNIIEIIDKLKTLYLLRKDKDELFNRVNYIRDSIHKKIEAKIKDNYSKAYNISCEVNNLVSSLEDLKKATQTLKDYQNKAYKYMLPKKERDEIKKKFQRAWDKLNSRKKESHEAYENRKREYEYECKNNKAIILDELNEFIVVESSNFKEKKEWLKKVQSKMKEKKFKKEDKEYIFKRINDYFYEINKLQKIVYERKQREWENKNAERERKQREWTNRLRDNISKKEESIRRFEDSISFDKNKLSEKKSKLYSISDKWKENFLDSMTALENKIRSKEDKLRSMYAQINNMKSKL